MSNLILRAAAAGALLLAAACAEEPASAQVPAFPGAEGAGAMSLGGRGGRVLRVTNLNDSGPGSFRAAVEAKGPRIIVFDVGGTIRLKTRLNIRNGRITIAGQTAPGGGITLSDHRLHIAADDVVVRFLRSRLGDRSGVVSDAIWVAGGQRIVLDHVSASWSTDEALSVSSTYRRPQDDLRNVTVQWSIIAESLCKTPGESARHCYGSIASGSRGARISFLHNLWAYHAGRMPRPNNYLSVQQDPQGSLLEFRSNVFYNWGGQTAGYNTGGPARIAYNFVDNSYWTGPDSKGAAIFDERNPAASAFFDGNMLNGQPIADPRARIKGGERRGYLLRAPVPVATARRDPAASAYRQVLAHAGASLPRDSVDARIVADVRNRTGGLIDSQRDVGGWPQLASGRPWVDSDGDGMPDDWERAQRFNPSDARDGSADRDRDGYTNVEEWLHALAAPAMG